MTHKNAGTGILTALAIAAAGTMSTAQAVEPMPYNDGPIKFIPSVKLSQGYDDNVDERPDDEESSNVTKVAPTFLFRAEERRNRYQFRYTPSLERYSHDSDDNRVNHRAAANSRMVFDARNRLDLGLNARRNQATLTSTNVDNEEDEGDINERFDLNGTYRFGAAAARGQFELDAGYVWNRYANHLEGGSNNQSEEYDSPRVGATFFWRVAPKTQLLIEGRYQDYDYTWDESTLDSTNMSAFVGATWRATAKTSGSVRVGQQDKEFDEAGKVDEDTTSWEAEVTWRPMNRSTVQVSTSNTLEEGSEGAAGEAFEETVEQTEYALSWSHDWDERVSSNVRLSFRDKDYLGADIVNDDRNDELTTASVGVSYAVERWLDVGIETRFKENDSTNEDAEYDRNTYFLTATLSL
ncbi:outer membrane beta-barrel protein [Spiribacter salinus]|uniref:outer membrane beta-barrel protein n=1 Tax=Spiribacter salinus TaxID=1335746 RepID=UPI001C93E165|nr:outer membrane beta-barrel protein [Spiribacter salinus]MBY5267732.1 hypothetical protein [Spiribacter salinus]